MRSSLAVVLAAGEGKRMESRLTKVLHPIAGLPMIAHVLKALQTAKVDRIAVVVAPGQDDVAKAVTAVAPLASIHVQKKPLGTGDALKAARDAIDGADDVLVVFGDSPFLSRDVIARLRRPLAKDAAVVVAGMRPGDPSGYGRLITKGRELLAIREEKDASREEKAIDLCNGGIMAFAGAGALSLVNAIRNKNAKNEFYLTDAVEIANRRRLKVATVEVPADAVFGINDRAQLAEAERRFQDMRRAEVMAAGATLIAPETVFFSHDTKLGRDVTVEPNVVFGLGVTIADNVTIHSFSHLEGATVASGAIIGPFARLPARHEDRRERPDRKFRRGQSGRRGGRREDQPPVLYRRRACRREDATSAPAQSPATMTALPSIGPTSGRGRSSARTPRWLHRSRSAMAPMSPRAASSPTRCRPTRSPSAAPARSTSRAGRRQSERSSRRQTGVVR